MAERSRLDPLKRDRQTRLYRNAHQLAASCQVPNRGPQVAWIRDLQPGLLASVLD